MADFIIIIISSWCVCMLGDLGREGFISLAAVKDDSLPLHPPQTFLPPPSLITGQAHIMQAFLRQKLGSTSLHCGGGGVGRSPAKE